MKSFFLKSLSASFVLLYLLAGSIRSFPQNGPDVETQVVTQLRSLVQSGKPVIVSELYNDVFTSPAQRKVIDRLYNIFFKVPIFVSQYYQNAKRPPTLVELSQQFNLKVEGEADLILKIMESDPRVPKFIARDPKSGEIMSVNIEKIQADPRFNKLIERSIAGWEGKEAPPFTAQLLDGRAISSSELNGKPYLVYFWFTHCPPCAQIMPHLVSLQKRFQGQNFTIVGLNADHVLELDYKDSDRKAYLDEHKVNFPVAHLTPEIQSVYGGVQLFPTLFLVDKQGIIRGHFVNYQVESVIQKAIEEIL
jgi:cytochrome c biogenesis protein CcmG, thiol:disulfide interchange protein DsbE